MLHLPPHFSGFSCSAAANQYLRFYIGTVTACQNVNISYTKRTELMNVRFWEILKDQCFLLKLGHRKNG